MEASKAFTAAKAAFQIFHVNLGNIKDRAYPVCARGAECCPNAPAPKKPGVATSTRKWDCCAVPCVEMWLQKLTPHLRDRQAKTPSSALKREWGWSAQMWGNTSTLPRH